MKDLYFVRHGETVVNTDKIICGSTDIELTELGREEADALGLIFTYGGYGVQEIICSPLIRARETAEIMSRRMRVPFRVDERLREQSFGKYEGQPVDLAEFREAKRQFADSFEGGESTLRLAARVYPLLDELGRDDRVYLIVAHSSVGRMINSYFNDIKNKEYPKYRVKKCIIAKFQYK